VDLRDHSGLVQCVVDGAAEALSEGSQVGEGGTEAGRSLRGEAHEQQSVPRAEVIDHVRKALQ
jgi:hypothetical protein